MLGEATKAQIEEGDDARPLHVGNLKTPLLEDGALIPREALVAPIS